MYDPGQPLLLPARQSCHPHNEVGGARGTLWGTKGLTRGPKPGNGSESRREDDLGRGGLCC